MKSNQIAECTDWIRKYNAGSCIGVTSMKNQIFNLLRPFIAKWISSALAEDKIFLDKNEIISLSWDCFEFCLESFKPDGPIPLPNHFHKYTKFFLMNYKKSFNQSEVPIIDSESSVSPFDAYIQIEELRTFRETLTPEYILIFDDALLSMTNDSKAGLRRASESSLSYAKYCEAKKVMKMIIHFLLVK
jgi:hypothetical protein